MTDKLVEGIEKRRLDEIGRRMTEGGPVHVKSDGRLEIGERVSHGEGESSDLRTPVIFPQNTTPVPPEGRK